MQAAGISTFRFDAWTPEEQSELSHRQRDTFWLYSNSHHQQTEKIELDKKEKLVKYDVSTKCFVYVQQNFSS
jgi:hypothetical protein